MNKKLLALLLALTMTVSLAACGGGEEREDTTEDDPALEETLPKDPEQAAGEADPETDQETAGTGENPTAVIDMEDEKEEQAKEPQVGQRPADSNEKPQTGTGPADSSEKPVSKPVEKPAEEQTPGSTAVDLSAFAAGLASSQTDWPGMMAMEGETLEAYYPGLSGLAPKQCVVQMAMISASGVEIALVEAADSADVDTIKGIFQARIDYQVGDGESPGGAWYPEPTEMWKNNSRIVSNGNYVMLVAYSGADSVVSAFNALFA